MTIRNLVIRKMPQKGIHAFHWMSDHWTIEYNEIAFNKYGLEFPPDSIIRNNYIHHNVGNASSPTPAERGGGYVGYYAHQTTFDSNEIAYNGPEQKVMESANVTFRNNFVHHNLGDGIWYDGDNTGTLVEGNRVEDNGRNGIFYEASNGGIIRNNTVRRNAGDAGVDLRIPERPDLQQHARRQFRRHQLLPQLRLACSRDTISRTMRRMTTRSSSARRAARSRAASAIPRAPQHSWRRI